MVKITNKRNILLNLCLALTFLNISLTIKINEENDLIDISGNYTNKIPKKKDDNDLAFIPIIGTNDFHGGVLPKKYDDKNGNRYEVGGGINIYPFVKIIRDEFENQTLWFDGGDQFEGAMEEMLTNGKVMSQYYNYVKLDAITLGNHDFGYNQTYLQELVSNQEFPTLVANMYEKEKKKYIYDDWNNVAQYKIFNFTKKNNKGKDCIIKIGVFGLATDETMRSSGKPPKNFEFKNYVQITKEVSNHLRNKMKVHAVLLISHFGPICSKDAGKMKLNIYEKAEGKDKCEETQEIISFLKNIKDENYIDGIIAAHVHDEVHHWLYGIPIIQSYGPTYLNVMYLSFDISDSENIKLKKDSIVIEGPIPACEKLWGEKELNCDYKANGVSKDMIKFKFHGEEVNQDQGLNEALSEIIKIINDLDNKEIGKIEDDMIGLDSNENFLYNFGVDIIRLSCNSDFSFNNVGGFRTKWYKGRITEVDLFNMFPFNNTLVKFEMTGNEVIQMFKNIHGGVIYPFSGAIQTFKVTPSGDKVRYEMLDIKGFDGLDEYEIDPLKNYTVCAAGFLARGGSGMAKVTPWYDLRNPVELEMMRDYIREYIKSAKIIKKKYFYNNKHPRYIIKN